MSRLDDAPPPEGGLPGWYRDPLGSDSLRMFDGSEWTSAIQSQGKVTEGTLEEDPVTPPPPSAGRPNPLERLPTWAKWTTGVVGALLLLGIGSAIGSSGEDDLKTEVGKLESQVDYAQEERDVAEEEAADAHSEASRVRGLRGKIVGEAEDRAADILSGAKRESEEAQESLGSLNAEVASTEQELASVEGSIGGAREEAAKSSFGDGIWQAESDFIPGTYRAPGGAGCYWATLNSADPYDIASNENGTGPQIAEINAPYFQTKGCGTWERINE